MGNITDMDFGDRVEIEATASSLLEAHAELEKLRAFRAAVAAEISQLESFSAVSQAFLYTTGAINRVIAFLYTTGAIDRVIAAFKASE